MHLCMGRLGCILFPMDIVMNYFSSPVLIPLDDLLVSAANGRWLAATGLLFESVVEDLSDVSSQSKRNVYRLKRIPTLLGLSWIRYQR